MMTDGVDLVKYITERVVTYIETPKDKREEIKTSTKGQKQSWQYRWFGMLPLAISFWLDKHRNKKSSLE